MSLRQYEIMIILDPEIEERTVAPSLDKYLNVVKSDGGSVDKVDIWGRRRLAYEIKGQKRGTYILVNFKAEAKNLAHIERDCNLSEKVLRSLVMRADHLTIE